MFLKKGNCLYNKKNFIYFENGKLCINEDLKYTALKLKLIEENNIWKKILKEKVKISIKNKLNKTETILEKGILTIKNKENKSYIKLRVIQKGDRLVFKILDAKLNDFEKKYFEEKTSKCLIILLNIVIKYYKNLEKKLKLNLENLKKETNIMKKNFNSYYKDNYE